MSDQEKYYRMGYFIACLILALIGLICVAIFREYRIKNIAGSALGIFVVAYLKYEIFAHVLYTLNLNKYLSRFNPKTNLSYGVCTGVIDICFTVCLLMFVAMFKPTGLLAIGCLICMPIVATYFLLFAIRILGRSIKKGKKWTVN